MLYIESHAAEHTTGSSAIRHSQVQASDAQTDNKDVRHSDHACPRIDTGLLNRTVGVGYGVVYVHTSTCLSSLESDVSLRCCLRNTDRPARRSLPVSRSRAVFKARFSRCALRQVSVLFLQHTDRRLLTFWLLKK